MIVETIRDVVDASHILAAQGILDAFGHVSCRSPSRPDRFLISRSMAPALVTPADVLELDLDGVAIVDSSARLFLERFIHGEIYRRRPDVGAIVHSHAMSVIPFTVVPTMPVRPIFHMCGYLHGTPEPFDVADHVGGSSDLLIGTASLGVALAEHLGSASLVLMRGHGYTAVGDGVTQATYRAIYAAKNCEVQMNAHGLGVPIYLSEDEAAACDATLSGQLDRAWDLWRRQLPPSEDRGENA